MTNDDDLRTALTKLAVPMYYDATPGAYPVTAVPMSHLLSVLAAHPVPAPVRSGHDIACDADYLNASCICDEITPAPEVCGNCLGHGVETCAAHPAPVPDTRREDMASAPDAGLTKEVVDAVTADLDAAGILTTTNGGQRILATALAIIRRHVAPAPPVVDEAEVRERIAQDIEAAARTDLALGLYGAIDIARGATR